MEAGTLLVDSALSWPKARGISVEPFHCHCRHLWQQQSLVWECLGSADLRYL